MQRALEAERRTARDVAAAPAAPVDVPDAAVAAADVSKDTMAAAALPAHVDMKQRLAA